jgi:Ca2+-binding RTX toxin-like protein
MAVTLIQSDLQFILDQILISEAHANGADLNDLLPNVFVPWGLRTVDGSYNNLVPGHQFFGAADQPFPTLLDPEFRPGYQPPNLNVIDGQPRVISNLIVDQTITNPAAVQAFVAGGFGVLADGTQINPDTSLPYAVGTLLDLEGIAIPAGVTLTIPNTTPDEGLSAGFNTWFVFFGQFFDHGLDFIQRGTEIVMIPFALDDPIFIEHPDAPPFMIIERTRKDAEGNAINRTTPFVDQNQTYTSHPSHQVFLREYVLDATTGRPVATGELIKGQDGGMATWADVKAQAANILGIELTDADVGRVPLVVTDAYGNFVPGDNGLPRLITGTPASPILVEGNLTTPVLASTAIPTGHAFIIDIAHSASPFGDHDGNPGTPPQALNPDADTIAGGDPGQGFYDDELLDAHLMAGDGRANENIALSAVHHVFHSEHNRLVEQTKETIRAALLAGDEEFAAAWVRGDTLADRLAAVADGIEESEWNGERLFQVARFGTEMQYQHLVFEEFARKVQPNVDEFLMYDAAIDPAIVAEFAHVVYRFGHSMLSETVDRFDPQFNVVGDEQITLIEAFLNPFEFAASSPGGADADAGAIVRGTTRQLGNEIDEFVTEALRNNLLGLPLDLASINLARGRETGVPTLNAARAEFHRGTGDSQLEAYSSWADFGANLKHFESLVNFIAAYGTHISITGATSLAAKRAAAYALVYGAGGIDGDVTTTGDNPTAAVPADRLDFLNSTGAWANSAARPKDLDGVTNTGLGNVDLWIGGLAERQMPFGGLLGSTFNFVFETQLEALQNGDRFYYLARTAGLNFLNELENNSFAKLIMANTDATHLPADVFSTPGFILEVEQSRQFNGDLGSTDPEGVIRDNPVGIDNPDTPFNEATANYLRYTGEDHVVLGGTSGDDIMIASIGDDTLWGDEGNDRLEGGDGVDNIEGGTGDDIITDLGGDDVLKGNEGNDVIHGGNGFNLLIGGAGQDFIITGEDVSETFAGTGNDFIYGAKTNLPTLGNEGDDWIEIGTQDGAPGDNFDELARDTVNGNDIFVGGGGFDEMLGEGGDDIFVGSEGEDHFDGDSGFDWVTFQKDTRGVTADMTVSDIIEPPVAPSNAGILDRYAFVEGLSGSALSDHLRGDDADAVDIAAGGAQGSVLSQAGIDLIDGLQELLGADVTSFGSGNIILGGSGSDIIEGRGGDDLIDGDRYLNVRISIRSPDGSVEWASADSMVGEVTRTNPAAPASITGPLHLLMLNGTVNPGQLQAVREILEGTDAFDTAVFSGLRGDYSIVFDDNGTADLSDDVVIVTDNVGTDGADRLINIERLQFSDQVVLVDPINGPALNAGPVGLATIDGVATEGQTLTLRTTSVTNGPDRLAGVSDADNPGGIIAKPFQVVWQAEVEAGTGVFEDIVLEGGDKASTASGTSFVIPDALEGLQIRAKIIYQDADGTLEMAFSAPTDAVEDAPAPVIPALPVEGPTNSTGVHFIRSDLQFILDQIKIAERHAAGEDLTDILPNSRVPFGLRTVDGSFNNLVLGQEDFGAADQPFTSLLDQLFRNENDDTLFMDVNGPLPGGLVPLVTNNNYAVNGDVVDFDPRLISNLIVDQTPNNPAAIAAALTAAGSEDVEGDTILVQTAFQAIKDATTPAEEAAARTAFNALVGQLGLEVVSSPGLDGEFGTDDDKDVFFLGNTAPDEGLSAGFNAWMTFFGQFFDHGLDLVNKGGNGIIYIPLQPDDPLYVQGGATNFMVLTRATNIAVQPGEDGILGTADDRHFHNNQTTPFVDQNQTYTSHPSHQVFLREYAMVDVPNDGIDGPVPVDTGRLLEGVNGGLATWADVKLQAATKLGIVLDDLDVLNLPLLATDPYGNFIRGPNGLPQLVTLGNPPHVEGDLDNPVDATQAIRANHAFLDDIAHTAVPVGDLDHNPNTPPTPLAADGDNIAGPVANPAFNPELPLGPGNQPFLPQPAGTYDDELLSRHFTTGDGRGNENIGLTAVHHVFHSEHNRLVDHIKDVVLASNDPNFMQEWVLGNTLAERLAAVANGISPEEWDGARLFQAARFGTEMQYQHLVFEEFARKIQPQVDIFFAPTQVYDTAINPAILAEFAHVVYRFGHSMLTETIDRFDPDFNLVGTGAAEGQQIGLIAAFLNPLEFAASGATADEAAGAIVRGTTRQLGNEIDEFVTEALRNNLLGLPLDLPAINLARGRDTGVPSLNVARAEFYAMTGDSQLKPYVSWIDFMNNLKHPESIINFIAAYGTHASIAGATTLADKRAAAFALVTGDGSVPEDDRLAFLNGTGIYAGNLGGLNLVDLWIGGLAERKMPFGGFLGSTFNFVFETQMELLQDGDRFYYLDRTNGLNFLTELENNSFAKLIMANTDAKHLPGDVFSTPAFILEVDPAQQYTGLGLDNRADPEGVVIRDNPATTTLDDPLTEEDESLDTNYLEYTGEDHVVLGGTNPGDTFNPSGNDILIASIGDDTVYGDGGNDRIEGGDGNDFLIGGAGDDIITDQGGDDNIQGLDGNDVIQAGNGINLVLGGFGKDFIITGEDASEAFGGVGDDFILGVRANEAVFGNEGDDWLQFGMADGGAGDNFDSFAADPVPGNDIFYGDSLADRMDGEGGDDIMMGNGGQGDRYEGMSGFDWASFQHLGAGVAVDMRIRAFDETPLPLGSPGILTRYEAVEGLSGSDHGDVLQGDDHGAAEIAAAGVIGHGGAIGSVLTNIALIDGLQEFLDNAFRTELSLPAAAILPTGVTSQTLLGVEHIATFGAGNIILGGGGSDIIIGDGGDDVIDGDMALNVYISVRTDPLDPNSEIDRAFELQELVPFMLSGQYNPSQLVVVRKLVDNGNTGDFDTARFSDVRANYTVTTDNGGTALDFSDDVVTVTHLIDDGGVLVLGPDGTDRLTHIERLQFADQAQILNGSNLGPVGLLQILDDTSGDPDNTPAENQLLRVSIAGVTDPNNPGGGAITGEVSYFWQVEDDPGSGIFEDIIIEDSPASGGETIRATGETFRPGDAEAGLRLRVKAVYQDATGVLEEVFSAPTTAVAAINDAPVGIVSLSDASPTETLALSAINAFTDADGIDNTVVFNYLWETSINGTDWATATDGGAIANDAQFIPTQSAVGQFLRVTVSYTDLQGNTNSLTSAPSTLVVGNSINTNGGTQVIDGTSTPIHATAGADLISTGAGTDFITALGGNDTIDGGTGLDIIDAGDGDDTINYALGGGADVVTGGAGVDTLAILGLPGSETFTVAYNGTTLTNAGVGSFNTVEQITLDLLGGNNTLSYGTSAAAVTVNLMTGQASGFTSIANVQNVTGGNGSDSITGGLGSNILSGGNGNDTFFALAGDGNDVVNGGGGTDTYDLSATSAGATIGNASAVSADVGSDGLTSIENIVGSQGGDTITFNGGANVLDGSGGHDTISAGAGNDSLLGGAGNDLLNGDAGNDTLRGGIGDDALVAGTNNDLVDGGDGSDTVTYTFGDGIDTVSDTGTTGSDTLNIVGTAAANMLDVVWNGSTLTNFETGTISGIESVTAALGDGTDTLIYATTTAPVTVDLGGGTATGFSSISGIENVTGGSGNDTLTGGDGTNVLAGGSGNDTYHVGTGDTVNENGGAGTDTLFSSAASFTLGANVENLTLEAGAGNIAGIGNGAANIITGNEGNNTLGGGAGNDVLNGGAGSDTMVGGAGGDTFVFGPNFGSDVIADFDANGTGALTNQDLLNLSLYTPDITAADIGTRLTILAGGGNTVISIDGTQQITLLGVTGVGANVITQQDFIF